MALEVQLPEVIECVWLWELIYSVIGFQEVNTGFICKSAYTLKELHASRKML